MQDFITENVPPGFIQDYMEAADAAFLGAKHIVDGMVACEEPERLQMLGQHRHWGLEQALRNAARANDLKAVSPHTAPVGGRYSLVQSGRLLLARTKITTIGGSPRPAKYMKALAQLNRFFEPYQWDMFLEELELPSDTVFGLMLTVAPKRGSNESRPAFVGIGVPMSNLKEWQFRDSLANILMSYRSIDVEEVPDRVLPKLKTRADRKTGDDDISS